MKDQKVVERGGAISVPMICFLLWLGLSEKISSGTDLQYGAPAASLKSTLVDHNGDEGRIAMSVAVSGVLQVYKNTGRKRDNEWSLMIET